MRITEIVDGESRVVVTKDRDFRDGHLLSGSPRRLLVVATGNITNIELLALQQGSGRVIAGRPLQGEDPRRPRCDDVASFA